MVKIGDLYPQLNEEQLRRAEANLLAYLNLAIQIYQRIEKDPKEHSKLLIELETEKYIRRIEELGIQVVHGPCSLFSERTGSFSIGLMKVGGSKSYYIGIERVA